MLVGDKNDVGQQEYTLIVHGEFTVASTSAYDVFDEPWISTFSRSGSSAHHSPSTTLATDTSSFSTHRVSLARHSPFYSRRHTTRRQRISLTTNTRHDFYPLCKVFPTRPHNEIYPLVKSPFKLSHFTLLFKRRCISAACKKPWHMLYCERREPGTVFSTVALFSRKHDIFVRIVKNDDNAKGGLVIGAITCIGMFSPSAILKFAEELDPLSPSASPNSKARRKQFYDAIDTLSSRAEACRERESVPSTPSAPSKSKESQTIQNRLNQALARQHNPFTAQELLDMITGQPLSSQPATYFEAPAFQSLVCGFSDTKQNILNVAAKFAELFSVNEQDHLDWSEDIAKTDKTDKERFLAMHKELILVHSGNAVSSWINYILSAIQTVIFMHEWIACDTRKGGKKTKTEHILDAFHNDFPQLDKNIDQKALAKYKKSHAKIIMRRKALYDAYMNCGLAVMMNTAWDPARDFHSQTYTATLAQIIEKMPVDDEGDPVARSHFRSSSEMLIPILDALDSRLAEHVGEFSAEYPSLGCSM
ncbi:hypothetical protein C8J56DRAFT_1061783 [Mycena floridula]|nr:hypothetical protein C8J56DRAFT_1061783 [Mycena floridula]